MVKPEDGRHESIKTKSYPVGEEEVSIGSRSGESAGEYGLLSGISSCRRKCCSASGSGSRFLSIATEGGDLGSQHLDALLTTATDGDGQGELEFLELMFPFPGKLARVRVAC